jgi:DNA-binding MarR family transcriptional regulator
MNAPAGKRIVRRPRRSNSSEAGMEGDELNQGLLTGLIGYVLHRAHLAIFADFYAKFAEVDIRPTQFSILTIIDNNPGLKQTDVSAALSIQRTNLVALLDTLESRNLICRASSPTDRRSHSLYLTDQGKALLSRLTDMVNRHEEHISRFIGTDGKKELITLLNKVIEAAAVTDTGETSGAGREAAAFSGS